MYKSLSVLLTLLVLCLALVSAAPQNNRNNRNRQGGGGDGQNLTPQERATQKPQGIFEKQDGTVVLDRTVTINNLPIRFKVRAPAAKFKSASGVKGAQADNKLGARAIGDKPSGMNVLLHGDGGQSFFDFPNQGINNNLMGVVVLAPDKDLKWGSADKGGKKRPNGQAHSKAVNELVTKVLPQMVDFNQSNVFFTGVSGGSLTLSGFFMPSFLGNFPNAGVLLSCGGLEPQVPFTPQSTAALANSRIHFQSTKKEQGGLKGLISDAARAYEEKALEMGMSKARINKLQTLDNQPNGGHCAFDGRDFVSGVQALADNFGEIMLPGGDGRIVPNGKGDSTRDVRTGVVGHENLFGQNNRRAGNGGGQSRRAGRGD